MKSWLLASALGAWALPTAVAFPPAGRTSGDAAPTTNELTLARLRPGRDTLDQAQRLYGAKHRRPGRPQNPLVDFIDPCAGSFLRLEVDDENIIQTITAGELRRYPLEAPHCTEKEQRGARLARRWKTGRGLALGDPRQRVLEIYGAPQSTGPSTQNGEELEWMFYSFDWAGSDSPQVLEITCERQGGRVVQITLAFPSV